MSGDNDVIDVDFILTESNDSSPPPNRKRKIVIEEEGERERGPLDGTDEGKPNRDKLIAVAGAAAFAWGFSELWKYLDRLEDEEREEAGYYRSSQKRLR